MPKARCLAGGRLMMRGLNSLVGCDTGSASLKALFQAIQFDFSPLYSALGPISWGMSSTFSNQMNLADLLMASDMPL